MNVVSYIRVSGRGQLDGDGPDRQRDSVAALIRAGGLKFAREFFEQGVSGTVDGMDRPAFREMIDYIETASAGPKDARITAIIIERMDRVARDLLVQEMLLKECRERGVQVFAADVGLIDQATNDGDPTRKLIRQVLGAVAEFAKSELVMKLAKARKRMKATTGRCEGQKPFGFFKNEGPILEFVRGCCYHSGDGNELSGKAVAELLNQAGFKTRRGTSYSRQAAEALINKVTKGTK